MGRVRQVGGGPGLVSASAGRGEPLEAASAPAAIPGSNRPVNRAHSVDSLDPAQDTLASDRQAAPRPEPTGHRDGTVGQSRSNAVGDSRSPAEPRVEWKGPGGNGEAPGLFCPKPWSVRFPKVLATEKTGQLLG